MQLWGDDTVILACSGAVTGDLTGYQKSGGTLVTPQLSALRQLVLSDQPPEAVVLSIGGNDALFSQTAQECIIGSHCSDWLSLSSDAPTTAQLERALAIEADVREALAKIDAAVNDEIALTARDGDPIPIVVLPYPRLLPDTRNNSSAPDGCVFGVSSKEATMLNSFEDAVNTSVTIAALSLHNHGRPVYLVDSIVDAFQPDHTVCEDSESYANRTKWPLVESMHPNTQGHAAIARALVGWSTTRSAWPIQVTGTPVYHPDWISGPPARWKLMGMPVLPYSTGGGDLAYDAAGYAPGSTVLLSLASSPRAVTSVAADETGSVSGWIRLPTDAPSGTHHLILTGPAPDGSLLVRQKTIRVLPVGGLWLFVGLGAGLVMAAVSVWGLHYTRGLSRRGRAL